jgi:nucleotide-binding universal stress UspA family protein
MSKKAGTVIIAVDNSKFSPAVVEEAAQISSLTGMKPVLVSVVKKTVAQTLPENIQKSLVKDEEKEFEDLHHELNKEYFSSAKEEAESEILHGDPAKEILELADDLHAGMIVMGTKGRGRLAGTLLGSVVSKVIRDANCPVLVVKTKKE